MRGEVFKMLPFSKSCVVPSLCVSTFSFSRAHPVLMVVTCIVAKKLLVIVNNSLLLSIMIKRIVLKHLTLLVGTCEDSTGMYYWCWDSAQVLLSCFCFTLHREIRKSLQWPLVPYPSDTHNVQCMTKIRNQYETVQQKCLAEMQLCKVNIIALWILGRIVGNSIQSVVTVIWVWGYTKHWDKKWNYFLTFVLFC